MDIEELLEVGQVGWFRPHRGEDIVGRVVDITPMNFILEGAVLIHEHGTMQFFQDGDLANSPSKAHVSKLCMQDDDKHYSLPRFCTASKVWRGDLDELRKWGDRTGNE